MRLTHPPRSVELSSLRQKRSVRRSKASQLVSEVRVLPAGDGELERVFMRLHEMVVVVGGAVVLS